MLSLRTTVLVAAALIALSTLPPAAPQQAAVDGCYLPGVHVFTLTLAQLTLVVGSQTDSFTLQGPTTVSVLPVGDTDGDGREELRTEILNFQLAGTSAVFGPVKLSESPARASMGLIEELSPGTCYPVASYFDVYVQAELPAPVHNEEPAHMTATLDAIPPTRGTVYGGPPTWVPLYLGPSHPEGADVDGAPIGHITHASHTPDEPLVPPTPPQCSDGLDNDLDGSADYPFDTGCRHTQDVTEIGGANTCPVQPVHTYGSGASAGLGDPVQRRMGAVTVWDGNARDCDGDGIPDEFDGDYDAGLGGGAFGYGVWASDPDCAYALNVHGPNVVVNDLVWGGQIGFVVGEDDQSGPIKVQDPLTLEYTCLTTGSITPCPSTGCDPADPTQDADDCVSIYYVGTGATCGTGGGDGLYWVILDSASPGAIYFRGNPPTEGTLTAF